MRSIRLSTYDLTNGTFDELTTLVEKGMLPVFAREPGFVNYGIAETGNRKVMAISVWETREQAQHSAATAATWVKENIADRVRLATTTIGDLALFHGVPIAA